MVTEQLFCFFLNSRDHYESLLRARGGSQLTPNVKFDPQPGRRLLGLITKHHFCVK